MSSGPLDIPLDELIRRAIASALEDVWTMTVGIVQTYDGEARTVDVQPAIKRAIDRVSGEVTHETLPVIGNCMVLVPMGSATSYLTTYPLQKGDAGMLVFSASSLTKWRETGQVSEPGDRRMHHLGSAVFIPGLGAKDKSHPQGSTNAMVIGAAQLMLGSHNATEGVGLGDVLQTVLGTIRTAYNGHKHGPSGTAVPDTLIATIPTVASAKVKVDT